MAQRRKPAIRRFDPRCYRKINSSFEAERRTGTTEHATIAGKVILIQNNGNLEGAVGIYRKIRDNTLAIQHWTNLFYTQDWHPIKWIIPLSKNSAGDVEFGDAYVEAKDFFGDTIYKFPELSERKQKQMSVLRTVIERELAKIELPKKKLSPGLKGQVKKNIALKYYETAEQIGKEVYFSRVDFKLPWRVA